MLALLLLPFPAVAAPPFTTDDPAPVDYRHVELDFFTQFTGVKGDVTGVLPALEADYGLLPNLEIHLVAPMAFDSAQGSPFHYGYGDTEFGFKYKFVHQQQDSWVPDVSIAPLAQLPTGDARQNLGNGNTREFFPLWAEKDFGAWETYGGGGYWNNPGVGNKNYWFAGWVLQYQITKNFQFGGEIFHQTASVADGRDSSGFNLGGAYDLDQHYHILLSAGRGLQNADTTNQYSTYAALQVTY